jgi:hypothetical protein
MVVTVHID